MDGSETNQWHSELVWGRHQDGNRTASGRHIIGKTSDRHIIEKISADIGKTSAHY
jgi:hypothetical protein